jgi:hypothetical protein
LLSPPHHTISRLVRVSQAPLSLSLVINIHMHFTANLKNPNQTHIYIQLSYARSHPLNQEERFLSQVFPVICRQHQPVTDDIRIVYLLLRLSYSFVVCPLYPFPPSGPGSSDLGP